MSEHGPRDVYEITWKSGYVERVAANDCLTPTATAMVKSVNAPEGRYLFYRWVGDSYILALDLDASDVQMVRNITRTEAL